MQFLGRIHSAEQTVAAVEQTRAAGFAQLNLDLIFAVPGQDLDDVAADVEKAVALRPDHISAYNLTFEEGTVFGTALKAGRMHQLPEEWQAAMYAMVRRELPRHGYAMYEISNYARPACEARHNLTYWRGQSYLAIGAGAHSYAASGPAKAGDGGTSGSRRLYRQGERNRNRGSWQREPGRGGQRVEFAFLNLRLIEGLELRRFAERFG